MKFFLILFLVTPVLSFCQIKPADHYKIFSSLKHKIISVNDIAADMLKADVIFFGEEHNDSTGHTLELTLLKTLFEKHPGEVALSMEMFETDCQTVLDEYLNALISEKSFVTDARAWPNYKDYRELIEYAKQNHIPVIAANAPSRYTHMVSKMGINSLQQLSPTGKSYLPPIPIDTAAGAYYNKFLAIMGGHNAMMGMQMYQAQNLWDATMGWSISKFYKKHPNYKILHLNGSFHSDEKLGAAEQLTKYSPNVRLLNITATAGDDFNSPAWSKYSLLADYIILTDPTLPKTF